MIEQSTGLVGSKSRRVVGFRQDEGQAIEEGNGTDREFFVFIRVLFLIKVVLLLEIFHHRGSGQFEGFLKGNSAGIQFGGGL